MRRDAMGASIWAAAIGENFHDLEQLGNGSRLLWPPIYITRYFSQAALSARITMPVKLRKTRAITFFADNYGCHITTIRCYKRSIDCICMNRVRRTPSFTTKRFYFIPQRFLDAPCVILLINLTQSPAIDVTPCS